MLICTKPEDMRSLCGERIREARKRCKFTQDDLAVQLQLRGIPANQKLVSRIELGLQKIAHYEIPFYADALNVTTDWLLGNDE